MSRFGVDRVLYYCPEVKHKVMLSLYYDVLKNEKFYTSIDCESKSECNGQEKLNNWENCPAYKEYVNVNK